MNVNVGNAASETLATTEDFSSWLLFIPCDTDLTTRSTSLSTVASTSRTKRWKLLPEKSNNTKCKFDYDETFRKTEHDISEQWYSQFFAFMGNWLEPFCSWLQLRFISATQRKHVSHIINILIPSFWRTVILHACTIVTSHCFLWDFFFSLLVLDVVFPVVEKQKHWYVYFNWFYQ